MIELQVLAALPAFERARERVLGEARRVGRRPAVAVLSGITLGWIMRVRIKQRAAATSAPGQLIAIALSEA